LTELLNYRTMTSEQEIEQLKSENALLREQVASQAALIAQLIERIQALEERLSQDSHNSSKPPSSDGFVRPPKKRSLRKASGKKAGGQTGHPGQALRQVEKPDEIITYLPDQCQKCHSDLSELTPLAQYEPRQVFELPAPYRLEVVEHRAYSRRCPSCQTHTQANFPQQLTNWVQYGPGIKALATYLVNYQLLPYGRASELLNDLYSAQISPGTLAMWVAECAEQLAESETAIKTAISGATVLHCDETGLYVEGKRQWLHVGSTSKLTYYAAHPKRGKAATTDIDVLPHFKGVAVHDGYASYQSYDGCEHALCNAHHLRELTFIHEQFAQDWAGQFKKLLTDLKAEVEAAKAADQTSLSKERLAEYEQRYQTLLEVGLAANPPPSPSPPLVHPAKRGRVKQSKAKNLLDRLDKHRRQVLRFAYRFEVPFDNNQAERDIRMVKVQQKVSGCFRTTNGAAYFCRIRGYLSSMRKQGENLLVALFEAFLGKPSLPPSLT